MVKTLRITSVIAALMAVAIFALPIKYGVRTDAKVEKFLNAPGVIEKFKASSTGSRQLPSNQVHPLVQQAQSFASIINPPKPVINTAPRSGTGRGSLINTAPPKNLTPNFKLISTSYCEQNPELSLALIDEPGKGKHWVQQSSTVNHLLIEQVRDGVVVVRNGDTTFETKLEPKNVARAVKNTPAGARRGTPVTSRPGLTSRPTPPVPVRVLPPAAPKTENDAERAKRVEELFQKIKEVGDANDDPDNQQASAEQKAAQIQKLITDFKNSNLNINDDEAKRLADLGETLDNMATGDSGDQSQ